MGNKTSVQKSNIKTNNENMNKEHKEHEGKKEHFGTIIIMGTGGVGKSTLGNLIRNPQSPEFKVGRQARPLTRNANMRPRV